MSGLMHRVREARAHTRAPAGVRAFSGFIPVVPCWAATLEAGGASVEVHETPMAHRIDPRVIPDAQRWLKRIVTTGAPTP